MAEYLRRYIGKYRVKTDYDLSTQNFVKDTNGDYDKDFDGMYIDCKNNIKIRHISKTSSLSCYIPNKTKGVNILKQIYIDKISNTLPIENSNTKKYYDKLTESLSSVLESVEVLDFEVCFDFKADMIDYIAEVVGARTSGAKISPFSTKNLPKESYIIPKSDLEKYQDAIKNYPTRNMGDKVIIDGLYVKSVNKKFLEQNKIKNDTKLKDREYVHKIGLWNKYCEFLEGEK